MNEQNNNQKKLWTLIPPWRGRTGHQWRWLCRRWQGRRKCRRLLGWPISIWAQWASNGRGRWRWALMSEVYGGGDDVGVEKESGGGWRVRGGSKGRFLLLLWWLQLPFSAFFCFCVSQRPRLESRAEQFGVAGCSQPPNLWLRVFMLSIFSSSYLSFFIYSISLFSLRLKTETEN